MSAKTKLSRQKQEIIDFFRGFGARIREARLACNLTEHEAADVMGVTVRRLRRFESGQLFRGNHRTLATFAIQFRIDLGWFYGGVAHGCPPRKRPKLTLINGGKAA